ncbi:hypothetical protein [Streptomyces sp. NPDC048665]
MTTPWSRRGRPRSAAAAAGTALTLVFGDLTGTTGATQRVTVRLR